MHTLTLDDRFQPWLCAELADTTRPVLNGVWFDAAGVCVATDTVMLCVCPYTLTAEGEFTGALIPAAFLSQAYKARGNLSALYLTLEGDTVSAMGKHGRISARLIEGNFPNWRRIIPDALTQDAAPDTLAAFNIVKLTALKHAVGFGKREPGVSLGLPATPGKPHLLPGDGGAFGILMPLYCEKVKEDFNRRQAEARALWEKVSGDAPPSPAAKKRKADGRPGIVPAPVPVPEPVAAVPEPVSVPEPAPLPVSLPVPPVPSRLPAWLAGVV